MRNTVLFCKVVLHGVAVDLSAGDGLVLEALELRPGRPAVGRGRADDVHGHGGRHQRHVHHDGSAGAGKVDEDVLAAAALLVAFLREGGILLYHVVDGKLGGEDAGDVERLRPTTEHLHLHKVGLAAGVCQLQAQYAGEELHAGVQGLAVLHLSHLTPAGQPVGEERGAAALRGGECHCLAAVHICGDIELGAEERLVGGTVAVEVAALHVLVREECECGRLGVETLLHDTAEHACLAAVVLIAELVDVVAHHQRVVDAHLVVLHPQVGLHVAAHERACGGIFLLIARQLLKAHNHVTRLQPLKAIVNLFLVTGASGQQQKAECKGNHSPNSLFLHFF